MITGVGAAWAEREHQGACGQRAIYVRHVMCARAGAGSHRALLPTTMVWSTESGKEQWPFLGRSHPKATRGAEGILGKELATTGWTGKVPAEAIAARNALKEKE